MELSIFQKLKPNKFKKIYLSYKAARKTYLFFKKNLPLFLCSQKYSGSLQKRFLIASVGFFGAGMEAIYAIALRRLGYEVFVITNWDPFVKKIFKLYGITNIYFYNKYTGLFSLKEAKQEAARIISEIKSADIINFNYKGVSVGKYAASTFMRITRKSDFDITNPKMRQLLIEQLGRSIRAVAIAEQIIKDINPTLVSVNDRGYTPEGQLFDSCLYKSIPVIQRAGAHKSGREILKRYNSSDMATIHHHSLSNKSWQDVKDMPWTEEMAQELYEDLKNTYYSGDWFCEVGTQFNKEVYSKSELSKKLELNPDKKTAVVFPHIFWDATFFWGKDLFSDYYDWFVNVLKVAKENDNLNWIIKIHPANIVKAKRDNYKGRHKELEAVYDILGELPSHVKVITPESDINTFSLFEIMDYCLTVRGTIGIEASMMGISTLTAGTGRYDRLGFTFDFDSREDYCNAIKKLHEIPPMSAQKQELARRFAYGIFTLRPCCLDIFKHTYRQDEKATLEIIPIFKTEEDLDKSRFIKQFSDFVLSGDEDFMDWTSLTQKNNCSAKAGSH
jgi:Capsule polysaccharide biosynthesis protein